MSARLRVGACPICHTEPGLPHVTGCDMERCSVCAAPWVECRHEGHDRAFSRWTGLVPGAAEAAACNMDLGVWLAKHGPAALVKPTLPAAEPAPPVPETGAPLPEGLRRFSDLTKDEQERALDVALHDLIEALLTGKAQTNDLELTAKVEELSERTRRTPLFAGRDLAALCPELVTQAREIALRAIYPTKDALLLTLEHDEEEPTP